MCMCTEILLFLGVVVLERIPFDTAGLSIEVKHSMTAKLLCKLNAAALIRLH